MLECMILGDSIGVGVSFFRKECVSYVKSGINTEKYLKTYTDIGQKTKMAIISLGTNDTDSVNTYENLLKLRQETQATNVVWILPSSTLKPKQHLIVRKIANQFGDSTLAVGNIQLSKDKIHPTMSGYKQIGNDTK